jgi:hypothetical protein
VAGDAQLPRSSAGRDRALGLLLGAALDAGFGRLAGTSERATWADSRARGGTFTAVAVVGRGR